MANKERLRAIIEGHIVSGIIQFLILASAVVFVLESDSTTDPHAPHAFHFVVSGLGIFLSYFRSNISCVFILNIENGISFSVFTA